MNLNLLTPDIQEKILFLPEVTKGNDPLTERQVRKIVASPKWSEERYLWEKIKMLHFSGRSPSSSAYS
jgi:hypothetical protein